LLLEAQQRLAQPGEGRAGPGRRRRAGEEGLLAGGVAAQPEHQREAVAGVHGADVGPGLEADEGQQQASTRPQVAWPSSSHRTMAGVARRRLSAPVRAELLNTEL